MNHTLVHLQFPGMINGLLLTTRHARINPQIPKVPCRAEINPGPASEISQSWMLNFARCRQRLVYGVCQQYRVWDRRVVLDVTIEICDTPTKRNGLSFLLHSHHPIGVVAMHDPSATRCTGVLSIRDCRTYKSKDF